MFNGIRMNLFLWIKPTSDLRTTAHLCYHQNPFLKTISSSTGESSLTALYLIESCGLSSKSALTVAQKLRLKSTEKPDSVLALLKDHGFTTTQVAKAIVKRPMLLTMDPDKTLKPKLEFIRGLGLSGPDLAKLLSSTPSLLESSLEKKMIPNFIFFKKILHTNVNVIMALKSSVHLLLCDLQKTVVPNIEALRNSGLPESSISKFIMTQPRTLFIRRPDQFIEAITTLEGMGFNLSSPMFVYGMRAMLGLSKPEWERKFDFFRSLGWSDSEIMSAFGRIPLTMTLSDDKIKRHMDFLVNTLKLKPESPSEVACLYQEICLSEHQTWNCSQNCLVWISGNFTNAIANSKQAEIVDECYFYTRLRQTYHACISNPSYRSVLAIFIIQSVLEQYSVPLWMRI